MFGSLKDRLPGIQQVLAVYGITALLIHGWTLIWLFWKLPSWEHFLTFGEMFAVFAYSMTTNLLESLVIMFALLSLSMILPRGWFKDAFLSRASWLVILALVYMMYIASHISSNNDSYPIGLVRLIPVFGVLILALSFFLGRISLTRNLVENLADRATIFSYIFLPLGLISLLIVIARNLF